VVPGVDAESALGEDIDGDGRRDLLLAVSPGPGRGLSIGVRRGLPSGGLAPFSSWAALDALECGRELLVGDFDGDTRRDILLSCNLGFTTRTVLLTPTTGTEATSRILTLDLSLLLMPRTGPLSRAGESRTLLIAQQDTALAVVRLEADDRFAVLERVPNGGAVLDARLADVNSDGRADLVWLAAESVDPALPQPPVMLWVAAGGATGFGPPVSQPLVLAPSGSITYVPRRLETGDFDGDGAVDVVVGGEASQGFPTPERIYWLRNEGGTFVLRATRDAVKAGQSLAVADVNGDGLPDVVSSVFQMGVTLLLGDRSQGLQAERQIPGGFRPSSNNQQELAMIDVDGDGLTDLVHGGTVWRRRSTDTAWPAAAAPGRAQAQGVLRGLRAALRPGG
jgi:hypothetical protein